MILVTGATGLVGGNLLWHLLLQNERVTAIRRSTSNLEPLRSIFGFYTPAPDEQLERIDWKYADILDADSLREAFTGIAQVYHCAAQVSLGGNEGILSDTNVLGTRNVVDIALEKNINKLCFVSSIAACGQAGPDELIDENLPWSAHPGQSLYTLSKYKSEREVWEGIRKGLNAVIVNPGVILGVSGTNSGSSQLFYQVRKGLMFYTNGGSGYVDVQDVARAMIQLMDSGISGERFVLVGENCSNKDILSWMADGFGKKRPFIPIGKKLLLVVGVLSELAGKLLRFRPLVDRGTARSATNRKYYSGKKIERAIGFKYTPVEKCILDVCRYMREY